MKNALICAAFAASFLSPVQADEPDTSTIKPTPNASWLIGEFERRYEKEAALYEEMGRLKARDRYIRDLIIDMFNREQMTLDDREGFIAGTSALFDQVDSENTADLKALLERFSWEEMNDINPDLLKDAFLIVQHSNDQAFQAQTLKVFEPMALEERISGQQYALLYDRVTLAEGGKQRYGTQYDCKDGVWTSHALEEPDTVDERRAAFDMVPLAEYLAQAETLYGACPRD